MLLGDQPVEATPEDPASDPDSFDADGGAGGGLVAVTGPLSAVELAEGVTVTAVLEPPVTGPLDTLLVVAVDTDVFAALLTFADALILIPLASRFAITCELL